MKGILISARIFYIYCPFVITNPQNSGCVAFSTIFGLLFSLETDLVSTPYVHYLEVKTIKDKKLIILKINECSMKS